jgi:hypothetical protein
MNQVYVAEQMHRAFQMLAQNLHLADTNAMEIADLYEEYAVGKTYPVGYMFKYGVNADGETQLYSVLQEHTSQENWKPNETPSLYKAVGFTDTGVAVWTQPLGATDAYMIGDNVFHKDEIWVSDVDNNVWEPGVYGWTKEEA